MRSKSLVQNRVKASTIQSRSRAVRDAVQMLEKRLLFSTIAFAENNYGTTSTPGVSFGTPSDPALVITTILAQPVTVTPVTGSNKTFSANKYTFLASDGTGSVEVYNYTTTSTLTYIPAEGDTISVTGTWSPYQQLPELATVTAISKTGTAAIPATTLTTVATLNPSDTTTPQSSAPSEPLTVQGYPLTLQGVTITGAGTTFGSSAQTAVLTDSGGNVMTFYTSTSSSSAAYSDLIGQPVPTGPTNVTGFIEVFKTGTPATYSPEFYPIAVGAPVIGSLSATAGPTAGTNTITINGYGFTTATAVSFGSVPASSYTLSTTSTDQQITAVVPAQSVGTVDVEVTNANGTSAATSADQYTYTVAPAVLGVSPTGGPTSGGTVVTITGSGFATGDTVKFGTVAGTSVSYSGGVLKATSPAETAATVDITVTNPSAQTSATSASDKFTYAATPSVTGLYNSTGGTIAGNNEKSGIDSGGDVVVITGGNFQSIDTVKFGTASASSVTYNATAGTLTATSPAGTAGTTVDVIVSNPAGSSTTSSADQFTYTLTNVAGTESPNLPASAVFVMDSNPVITQILSIAGQTVTDSNFNYQTYNYTSFYIQDSTGSEELFGSKDATGAASLPGGYVPTSGTAVTLTASESPYHQAPEIASVTAISNVSTGNTVASPVPTTIPHVNVAAPLPSDAYGYIVTIKGVYISGLSVNTFDVNNTSTGTITDTSGNQMQLFFSTTYNEAVLTSSLNGSLVGNLLNQSVPTNTLVDVTGYIDIDTTSTTEFNLIAIHSPSTLAPVISSTDPSQGPLGGTNSVTISGYGFTGVSSVSFGGTPGTNVRVVNDQTILVTAPAHALGMVNLMVTNGNGTSNAVPYVYTTAPVVNQVSPGGTSTSGGPSVVITGTGFTGATSVKFGTTTLTSGFTVNSDTQITVASAPAHAAGLVDVTVTAPASGGGSVTSSSTTLDQFIYDTIPTVSISPATGVDNGGTSVVITGTSLLGTSSVYFGTVPATSFTYNSTTGAITAVSPAQPNGTVVDVKVTNYAGTSTTVASDQFTYTPTTVVAAQNLATGTFVTIDSNPVITAILSQPGTVNGETYAYYAFLVQDATGSEDVFYNPASQSAAVAAFIPVVGNTITVTGKVSPFNQVSELGGTAAGIITAISNTGTAAVPAPLAETVSAINIPTFPQGTGFGTHYISLSNVTVGGTVAAGTLSGTTNSTLTPLTVTDSTGTMTLFYYTTSYSTANEQFAGSLFPAGPETLDGFVYVFSSGSTHTAEFVPTLDVTSIPAWLAPSSQAIFNSAQKKLYVNGLSTIIADPGTDNPFVTAPNTNNSAAVLNIAVPNSGHAVHIGGLSLTVGATLNVNASTGTPTVLVDANAGGLTLDGTSVLNLNNNFLDIQNSPSLSTIDTLLVYGSNGGLWTGTTGITSGSAASDPTHLGALGAIVNTSSTGGTLYSTFGGAATGGATDVLIRYTFVGDANLDGHVDGSDYSDIDSGFATGATPSWITGDFNYDGTIDGSDYTLIDNAYNQQGHLAGPTALIAAPTGVTSTSTADSFFSKKKISSSLIGDVEGLITGSN